MTQSTMQIHATIDLPLAATYSETTYEWIEEKLQELAEVIGGKLEYVGYEL